MRRIIELRRHSFRAGRFDIVAKTCQFVADEEPVFDLIEKIAEFFPGDKRPFIFVDALVNLVRQRCGDGAAAFVRGEF